MAFHCVRETTTTTTTKSYNNTYERWKHLLPPRGVVKDIRESDRVTLVGFVIFPRLKMRKKVHQSVSVTSNQTASEKRSHNSYPTLHL